MSQSNGLSNRLKQMVNDGKNLNDDSSLSEKILADTMSEIIPYAIAVFKPHGYNIVMEKQISLYECQTFFEKAGGPIPNPDNKNVSMRPDGGILFAISDSKRIPILIVEDKVQGTNDSLFIQNKKRQSSGNAIERAAKNIRGAEMLFAGLDIFPYVLFASGCDFHSTETISKRIEMMNFGYPNNYINITTETTKEQINTNIRSIIESLDVKKKRGKCVVSVCVKAHKWDEMGHGSSRWEKDEQLHILKKVIDSVYENLAISLKQDT